MNYKKLLAPQNLSYGFNGLAIAKVMITGQSTPAKTKQLTEILMVNSKTILKRFMGNTPFTKANLSFFLLVYCLLTAFSKQAQAVKHEGIYLILGTNPSQTAVKLEEGLDDVESEEDPIQEAIDIELSKILKESLLWVNKRAQKNPHSCLNGLHAHYMGSIYQGSTFSLITDMPQADHSGHLRFSIKNKHESTVIIDIAYKDGRFAFQPFFLQRDYQGKYNADIAWYLLDAVGGEGTGLGETLTVMSQSDSKRWLHNDRTKKELHDHIVYYFRQALEQQIYFISQLTPQIIQERIEKMKREISAKSHLDESNYVQIVLDNEDQETGTLLIGRWDDFSAKLSDNAVRPYIPHAFETRAVGGSVAVKLLGLEQPEEESLATETTPRIDNADTAEHTSQIIFRIKKLRAQLYGMLLEHSRGRNPGSQTNERPLDQNTNIRFSNALNHTPFRGEKAAKTAWKKMIHTYVVKNRIPHPLEQCEKQWLRYLERKLAAVKENFQKSIEE